MSHPLQLPSAALLTLLLAACATDAERPALPQIDTQVGFSATAEVAPTTQPWWESALGRVHREGLEKVLRDNPRIRLAATEVDEDRARLDGAEAERWLDVGASAASRARLQDGEGSVSNSIGLDARLPLDLFDRLALSRDAAAFDLAQSLAQLEDARLQQVQAYLLALIDMAESAQLVELLQQQLDTAATLLQLTELRFSQGLASSVDVLQQRQQLASLRRGQPIADLRLRQAANQAAELQGGPPPARIPPVVMPAVAGQLATIKARALLQRRPDLVAQRAALMAADRRYDVALRTRLPEASLSVGALLSSLAGDQTALISAAIEASASLFDSGRNQALSDQQAALLQQAGIRYLQTWLAALRETDDLLNQLLSNRRQLDLSETAMKASEDLFSAARRRYERGISDYLPVLSALSSLQQQQREMLALRATRQRTLVRLQTALGLPQELLESRTGPEGR